MSKDRYKKELAEEEGKLRKMMRKLAESRAKLKKAGTMHTQMQFRHNVMNMEKRVIPAIKEKIRKLKSKV